MRVFHQQLLAANPERLLWASDWPHINMHATLPDAGHLVDMLSEWTQTVHCWSGFWCTTWRRGAPIKFPEFDISMYWHPRYHQDPALLWLRGAMVSLFAADRKRD